MSDGLAGRRLVGCGWIGRFGSWLAGWLIVWGGFLVWARKPSPPRQRAVCSVQTGRMTLTLPKPEGPKRYGQQGRFFLFVEASALCL